MITEIKNTLEGINSRISEAEELISELKDNMLEITSVEQNKVKRMKKKKQDSLRDHWDNIKCTNIRIMVSQKRKRKRKHMRKYLKILQRKISPIWDRK